MKIEQIKQLHRKYFESQISIYYKGRKTEIPFKSGKYYCSCNQFETRHELGCHEWIELNYTPTFYSIFLCDVKEKNGIVTIKENKSIDFPNTITVYDKKHIKDVWRIYRNQLNIPNLKEYKDDIFFDLELESNLTMNNIYNAFEEELFREIINNNPKIFNV